MNSLFTTNIPPRAAAVGVALALLASVVAGPAEQQPAPIAEPRVPPATRDAPAQGQGSAAESAVDLDLDKLKRRKKEETIANLFAPRSFAPPPIAASVGASKAEPAPPVAPPLPFRYLGRIIDGGQTAVFVARGDEPYGVEPGQRIDQLYQVDEVTETAVTFIYLPLGTRQSLPLPALN